MPAVGGAADAAAVGAELVDCLAVVLGEALVTSIRRWLVGRFGGMAGGSGGTGSADSVDSSMGTGCGTVSAARGVAGDDADVCGAGAGVAGGAGLTAEGAGGISAGGTGAGAWTADGAAGGGQVFASAMRAVPGEQR